MGTVPTETDTNPTATPEGAPPPTEPQLPATLPPWQDAARKRLFVDSLRRGDRRGVLAAFHGDDKAIPSPVEIQLADTLIELRRSNVGVLGAADVFVRRTDAGELEQVIAPVQLSLKDGTLYQIPDRWEKLVRGQPDVRWNFKDHRSKPYDLRPVVQNPERATVSAEGYLRMNAVAGCSVVLPSTVWVDGVERMNPFVQRDDDGDPIRIVISVRVAGPAPLTGNIVLVQYVLDMDPRVDLLHMLAALMAPKRKWNPDGPPQGDEENDAAADAEAAANTARAAVKLMSRQDYNDWRRELDPLERIKWHWMRLQGPIGYAHNLQHPEVQKAYTKYLGIIQNATKKAQTIARRNAMKAHPALARHAVVVGNDGTAIVPVTGWTARGGDLGRYAKAIDELARSDRGMDVIDATETYDPAQHETGDDELDARVVDQPPEEEADGIAAPPAPVVDVRRNEALAQLDEVVLGIPSNRELADLGYPPGPEVPTEAIEAMLREARVMARKAARRP